jgi:hypothetical protein
MTDLVVYDRMCSAIAECHRVDEVKELHNKARALEIYAKQAQNLDAEQRAREIRLRAERRTGELLKELARATPAQAGSTGGHAKAGRVAPASVAAASPYREALQQAQIPERTAQRYQTLAAVPAPAFEQALANHEIKPSTATILRETRAKVVGEEAIAKASREDRAVDGSRGSAEALWVWGRLKDFDRADLFKEARLLNLDPAAVAGGMTVGMQGDAKRLLPQIINWLTSLEEAMQ